MKTHLLFLFGLIISISVLADVPQGISHQAVMRDAENVPMVNQAIGLQISILQGAHNGEAVYVETHTIVSNQNGLISYVIGEGNPVEGLFDEIDWSDGPYWLETKADPAGGTNYSIIGVTQFLSVPYAMHAATADKAETLKDGSNPGEIIYWDGEQWASIAPGQHSDVLRLCNGVPTWGDCKLTLTLLAEPAEGGSVTGDGMYEEGSEVPVAATPAEGWEFVNWTGDTQHLDDADSAEALVTMPVDNVMLTANFVMTDYVLTLIAEPEEGGEVSGAGVYNFGDEVPIAATANEGWEFVEWTGDTEHLDNEDSAEAVVTMPAENVALTAVFQEEDDTGITYGDGVTDIDGNEYITVIIGNQEWMAENLRVTRYNNGGAILTGLPHNQWGITTSGAYAIYDHNHSSADGINSPEEMVAAYGKLYNWYAVDDTRGLCPEGWSVPSHDDWTQLEQYICNALGNSDCETQFPYDNTTTGWRGTNEGNSLKSCRQLGSPLEGCNTSEHPRWNSHNTNYGFDEFGFSALPGGTRGANGYYANLGFFGHCWSSSEFSSSSAWGRYVSVESLVVNRGYVTKRLGRGVRCVRDETAPPPTYNLNLETSPAEAGSVTGAGQYEAGEQVNITATASEGWEFVNWTGDTQHLDDATSAEAVVTMPAENVMLTAVFQEFESVFAQLTITVICDLTEMPIENAYIELFAWNGDFELSELTDENGKVIVPGAPPGQYGMDVYKEGYDWYWFEFEMEDEDLEIVVRLGQPLYELSLSANPTEGGTVEGAGEYIMGETVHIAAVEAANWQFAHWTGDIQFLQNDIYSSTNLIFMPDWDVSLEARFYSTILPTVEISMLNNSQPGLTIIEAIVLHDPGADDSARGFVWSTEENPSLEHNEGISDDDGTGLGEFFIELTDLTPNIRYYIRGYATNSEGTAYSDQHSFHFWDYHDTVYDIDNNIYQTVIIGNQEWMAENLRVTRYNNEDDIPTGLSNTAWSNTTSGAYAIYDHNEWNTDGINSPEEMVAAYGKLYNWYAVDDTRGLCPGGWSVPSDDDWTAFVNYVVSQGFPNEFLNPNGAGNTLKSCRQVGHPDGGDCDTSEHPRWHSNGTHSGFDEFGFSALPGGIRYTLGSFSFIGYRGSWWSSSEGSSSDAWYRYMGSGFGGVDRSNSDKRLGLSVRCVRDIVRTEDE